MDGAGIARRTRTTCPYCGVGCGIIATQRADGSIAIEGDPDHPANFGRLCSKGSALGETLDLDGRLLHPVVDGKRASWDQAFDRVAETFSQTIAAHGPDSVAFYVSGQFLTEDYYVANKLMKGFIGSANIDTNSRLCMASSVAGHNRAFGADTVPGVYEDLELADLIVLVGSNLAWCHPVLFQRILAAKAKRPKMKLVVIDPRRTVTADAADLHLAIKPDGDTALFKALLRHLYLVGALDCDFIAKHTTGFAAALGSARTEGRDDIEAATGLSVEDMNIFFEWFTGTEKAVTAFSQGVNQSTGGTDKVNAIINCHLATGRIGRPGMGPFSVTGQPNAMGGREVGGLANQLAAHMKLEDPLHREIVGEFWGTDKVPAKSGLKAVDLFRAVADGRVKAIWIMATNPVDSLPEASLVEAALQSCPFVVVSDVIGKTDTIKYADVRLPAAAWAEKDGTVTNSERRISRQRGFLPLPGEALPDWLILTEVAKRMGYAEQFDYTTPADVFRESARLSAYRNNRMRAFDIGAYAEIADDAYNVMTPFLWPSPAGATDAGMRMYAEGGFFTPDGKARFIASQMAPRASIDRLYPLTLSTGRVRDHWHTMTRTGKSPKLSSHYGEPFVALHPDDAAWRGISDADLVTVSSRLGNVVVRALLTDRQMRGMCFVPMHWTDEFAADSRVGKLIEGRTDPISGQPALKRTDVAVHRFKAVWYGFAAAVDRPRELEFAYWAAAKVEGGWRMEMADDRPCVDPAALAERLFGCARSAPGWLAYCDDASGTHRFAAIAGGRLKGVLYLSRKPVEVSRAWAAAYLRDVADGDVAALLAGRAGEGRPDAGAMICACFAVGANQIKSAAIQGCVTVEDIGVALQAGTNCGSCRTEIVSILESAQQTAKVAAE